MSLRVRLVLLILVVVALAAVALSAVELETLVDLLTSDAIERSSLTGQQVSALLLDHIDRYSENYPVPQSLEETKALWNDIVSDDEQFHRLLLQMVAHFIQRLADQCGRHDFTTWLGVLAVEFHCGFLSLEDLHIRRRLKLEKRIV